MSTLVAASLRIIAIAALVLSILVLTRALLWVVKPWLPLGTATAPRLLVDPFEVVKDGDAQRKRGEGFSRLLSLRMRQLGAILSADLPRDRAPAGAVVEGAVPKQVARDAVSNERLDFGEVKAFGIDVAGVMNEVRRYLQRDDRIRGTVVLGSSQLDVFAEVESDRGPFIGPWDFSVSGTLSDAADALSYRVVKSLLGEAAQGLNDTQFRTFVEALAQYQVYVRSPGQTAIPSLDRAEKLFKALESENVTSARIYSYLASIRTIRDPKDIDTPIKLMAKALELDPTDTSFKQRLDELLKKRPTVTAQEQPAVSLPNLSAQASFAMVHMPEALAVVQRRHSVTIAVVGNGFNTAAGPLATANVTMHSVVPSAPTTRDDLDYGTSVASYVATAAPSARLLLIKAFNDSGVITQVEIADATNYAVAQKADVLLLTLFSEAPSNVLKDALDEAATKGLVVIASAGNNASDRPEYPAAYPSVIAVGGTDATGARASYSTMVHT